MSQQSAQGACAAQRGAAGILAILDLTTRSIPRTPLSGASAMRRPCQSVLCPMAACSGHNLSSHLE